MLLMNAILAILSLVFLAGGIYLFVALRKAQRAASESTDQLAGDARHAEIVGLLSKIPDITVNKAVGTTNVERGSLGEMISFLRLKNTYDKVLPFHDVVDFIGIKFPADKEPGALDFIEVKTGKARLTKEQLAVRSLIKERKINFIKMHVSVNDFTAAQDDENKS